MTSAVLFEDHALSADIGMAGQSAIPAAFMRGGTSKGLFFLERDLPGDRQLRNAIFLRALGSPDPEGRQLDGMGGGLSSLSKIVVVRSSQIAGAVLDYEFGQVGIKTAEVDYTSNCGNLTSAVGEFAASQKLIPIDWSSLALFNINTRKFVRLTTKRDLGVEEPSGQRPILVTFLDVGGETTGRLFPLGEAQLQIPFRGRNIGVTIIDAGAPLVILSPPDIEISRALDRLETQHELLAQLESLRQSMGRAMGLADEGGAIPISNPSIALVAPPLEFTAIDAHRFDADSHDLTVRFVTMGRFHRASPLTGAIALAVAASVAGTVPSDLARSNRSKALRLAHPAGVLTVQVSNEQGHFDVAIIRTARRLMSGLVHV